jgi:hypothetical protein
MNREEQFFIISKKLKKNKIVSLLGPRQSGKTTLARYIAKKTGAIFFDLENPADENRFLQPMLALEQLRGLVILDEVQRVPAIFPVLRVLADRLRTPARFLLLGSASTHLVKGVSESLAGRTAFHELGGFSLGEVGHENLIRLWVRGGFPRSYLENSLASSFQWRENFIRSFLERDIPQLGITIPASALRKFWTMIAHYHGNVWNAAEFARSIGRSESTARHYLDILDGTFLVRQLQPWFANISKRQVKSPKIYIRDCGLLHSLLGLSQMKDIQGHPKLGASWEGFVIEEILKVPQAGQAYFWATHAGAELDLLLIRGREKWGIEIKYSDRPWATKSMHIAMHDLDLHHLYVICPNADNYKLTEKIEVIGLPSFLTRLSRW